MVLLRMRIRVSPADRTKVVRSLSRVVGPSRAASGCVSCGLYADLDGDGDGALLFVEEWADERSMAEHLHGGEHARVLLSALDYACDPPDVRVDTLVDRRGMEFIAACREARLPAG
jgi:quinol monooxygenase YgiN